MRWSTFTVLVLLALGLAWFYRFGDLALRPMHTDEAILGIKFLDFWKTGYFDYDPKDYHGPFLHCLTRVFAWIWRWHDPALVTEADLRAVIAVCGMVVVLATLLLTDALGRMATAMAMLMMAVSPMMVFYSRYFIMEVPFVLLLALFIAGCWRFSRGKAAGWLLLSGAALGCLHATKETFVINLAAMGCGWIAGRVLTEGFEPRSTGMRLGSGKKRGIQQPWLWVAVTAVLVSVALFSGFFKHWDDVKESVLTYQSYVKRSGGAGGHEKPWNYYLKLIFWYKNQWVWSEAMIGGLAVLGMLRAFFGSFDKEPHRRAFLVFLSIYALAALTAYSIIPYKTPWTILSVQWALALLAGVGASTLFRFSRARVYRLLMGLALTAGIYHLCYLTKITTYYPVHGPGQDQPNMRAPYIYSHTSMSAMKLINRLRELAAFAPKEFSAQVINADSGWPLPWYLRNIPAIGYQMQVPEQLSAPVIVVDLEQVPAVKAKLGGKAYESDFFSLREDYSPQPKNSEAPPPQKKGTNVELLVEKGLWDRYLAQKAEAAPAAKP